MSIPQSLHQPDCQEGHLEKPLPMDIPVVHLVVKHHLSVFLVDHLGRHHLQEVHFKLSEYPHIYGQALHTNILSPKQ